MKLPIIIILAITVIQSYSQSARIVKIEKGSRKNWAVIIEKQDKSKENYFASCYFKNVTMLPDSTKISLIEQLLKGIKDTSYCYQPVEALSYRYNGRNNKSPKSSVYNLQIAALILINYIALSSEAVVYSPYPVLYDKKGKKEITTAGNDLDVVLKVYQIRFKKIN